MKKSIVIFFVILIATGTYLYNYSLNIHVQKFRTYVHLYLKHTELSNFAESLLDNPNVKKINFSAVGLQVEYFEDNQNISNDVLEHWEKQLKENSVYFVKVTDRKAFLHIGSIPYNDKTILVGLKYRSGENFKDNCISVISETEKGRCNEKFNSDWLISFFWHGKFG